MHIDPISTGTLLTPRDPINVIKNPAAIVVLEDNRSATLNLARVKENAAIIEVSKGSRLPNNAVFQWKIESVDLESGDTDRVQQTRALFFDNSRTELEGGTSVLVYGVKEGRVRITASLKGNPRVADFHEAIVAKQRAVPFRVQFLHDCKDPNGGAKATAGQARDHVAVANIYLRQVGVRLVPHRTGPVTHGARPATDRGNIVPGYFDVQVKPTDLRDVTNDDAPRVIRFNAVPWVVQIMYIESMQTGAAGRSINYPDNRYGSKIRIKYRARGDDAPRRRTMLLTPAKLRNRQPGIWGVVLTIANEKADPEKTLLKYANTLAHEFGHVFDLAHRAAETDDPKYDGMRAGGRRNLMNAGAPPPEAEDLDLIQAVAIRGSKVFDSSIGFETWRMD